MVAAYTVDPDANTPRTELLPRPLVVVRLVKRVPPFVEMLNPPWVAAYTVDPDGEHPAHGVVAETLGGGAVGESGPTISGDAQPASGGGVHRR